MIYFLIFSFVKKKKEEKKRDIFKVATNPTHKFTM